MFPIAIAIKTTPIVAIAPLLVIWLGTGWWSKIVAAILICFFPVLVNTVKGLKAADLEYRELFETLGASQGQEFRKLRVPYCLPYLFSALKISSSLAVIGAIVGEFVGATQGLGYLIIISSAHLGNRDDVFGDHRRGVRRHRHVLWDQLRRASINLLVERRSRMTTRTIQVDVIRIPTKGPGDVSGLLGLIAAGKIEPSVHPVRCWARPRAMAASTTSPANTPWRPCAKRWHRICSSLRRAVEDKIAFVMSGGTEGVLSPHLTVFARSTASSAAPNGFGDRKRLSIGIAHTPRFPARGDRPQGADGRDRQGRSPAMADASIDNLRDVHFVQIKCPPADQRAFRGRAARGCTTVTTNGYSSMGYSRGASALGVAMALGELKTEVHEDQVLKDWDLFSSVASSSAGIEIMHNVVIVMGNSPTSLSPFVIGHAVMRNSIDLAAVVDALKNVGLSTADAQNGRLVNIFAKAEASPDGCVRGFRHTMLDDSDVGSTRHARAAVGGLVAGLSGTGAVYVSGGAEHQGPPGGGPVAVIARV